MFKKVSEHMAEIILLGLWAAGLVSMMRFGDLPLSNPFVVFLWVVFAITAFACIRAAINPDISASSNGRSRSENDVDDNRHNVVFRGAGYPFTDINAPDD